jgi:lambda family phage portal protein
MKAVVLRRRSRLSRPASPVTQARQGYDGAANSRLTGDWFPGGLDFNALISQSSPSLRARVRDLVRNFPPFARAVNAVVAFTVGRGARFQSLALSPSGEPDIPLRRMIEERFRAWMERADVTGKLHFYELQQLAKRQECECGEYIARFTSPRGKDRHSVAVQMFEPEQLNAWEPHLGRGQTTDIWQGVEFDVLTGEPVAYHFQTSYPWQRLESWREPAENVLHGFNVLRPGQLRGMTPFAPAVMLARDMGDYAGAEIDAAKMAAKYLAIVESPDPAGLQAMRAPGPIGAGAKLERPDIEWLENAAIEYLRTGEKMNFAPTFGRPGDSFDRFTRFVLRMVGITMDLPYEILSGDYQGINYSTSKAVRNDFSMFLVPHQFRLEAHFVRPVFHRWLAAEALSGDGLRGYFVNPARFRRAMWIPAGMPSVDPLRDGKADIDSIASGIKSPQQVILGQGQDPEEVVAQRAAWRDLCLEYGVDATTGGVSTALAHNPAKLGAVEQMEDNPDQPDFEG